MSGAHRNCTDLVHRTQHHGDVTMLEFIQFKSLHSCSCDAGSLLHCLLRAIHAISSNNRPPDFVIDHTVYEHPAAAVRVQHSGESVPVSNATDRLRLLAELKAHAAITDIKRLFVILMSKTKCRKHDRLHTHEICAWAIILTGYVI